MGTVRAVKFLSLKAQHDRLFHSLTEQFVEVVEGDNYILGPRVLEFERAFADYSGVEFCVGVGTGLDALTISLRSLGLEPGDEVIVPANTYAATWLAVKNCGATVIPAEPDPNTFNLAPERVQELVNDKTRVILPVHLYGQPCDMTQLTNIARRKNIYIVEDNAQAHGATWNGKKTGSWGIVNATSFYPTKNLGAIGDGGAITTSDGALAQFARSFRNYGSSEKNYFEMQGINSRLDEIQAAFLRIKLNHLDDWNLERRKIAQSYNDRLGNITNLKIPYCAEGAHHVYHLYVIQCERRDDLKTYLAKHGIETMVHYPVPPHQQKAYQDSIKGRFPVTEKLASSVLSLPLWPGMEFSDVDYTCEKIAAFYR